MIRLTYFAWVRERVGCDEEDRDLPEGITDVAGLIDHLKTLGAGHARAFEELENIRAAVNMKAVPLNHPIADGDEVAFFPPMTGGAPETETEPVTITDQPIDVAALLAAAHSTPETGGVVSFTGTVRSSSEAPVDTLTLEHYPGMTEKALGDIAQQAHTRWTLTHLTITHRVGPMVPGDVIVCVIAGSAHREEAFEAARFVMDYLKTDAPFWKKERAGGKDRWVEARASDDAARDRWKS